MSDAFLKLCREWLDCCRAQVEALGRSDWDALARILDLKEGLQSRLEMSGLAGAESPHGEKALGLLREAYALESESQSRLDEQMNLLAQQMRSLHRQQNARKSYHRAPGGIGPRYMDKRR